MSWWKVVVSAVLVLGPVGVHASMYEEALKQVLASESLRTVKVGLSNLELTETKIEKAESRKRNRTQYKVTLFYSAIGTAGGCYVHADVLHSQMEIVAPGGGGFQVRDMWSVQAKQGICPR